MRSLALPPLFATRRLCSRAWGGVWLVCALVLAGCAGPARPPGGANTGGVVAPTAVPPVQAKRPDRDGPPLNPPSDLAMQPDPAPQVEPIRVGGPNKPYAVLGQSYAPVKEDVPFKEKGLASWYGTKFHGRKTASGELYSVYGLTAAHRTLPIPSYVRVRVVSTGKEVVVRVNDRGPFHSSRIMDLSYAAAVKLGVANAVAEVEIERLTFEQIRTGSWRNGALPEAGSDAAVSGSFAQAAADAVDAKGAAPAVLRDAVPAQPTGGEAAAAAGGRAYTATQKGFWVQLAALGRRDGVEKLQQRIADELQGLQPMLAVFQEATLFKLQVGPYGTKGQALAAARQAGAALQLSPLVIERR